jgi:hypothetical protein
MRPKVLAFESPGTREWILNVLVRCTKVKHLFISLIRPSRVKSGFPRIPSIAVPAHEFPDGIAVARRDSNTMDEQLIHNQLFDRSVRESSDARRYVFLRKECGGVWMFSRSLKETGQMYFFF